MPAFTHLGHQCNNHLLSSLRDEEYQSLLPDLQFVETSVNQEVGKRYKPIEYIYFPCNSVLSVLALMQDGAAVEVGTIGNEGFYGIEALVGGELALETTVCQVKGNSLRMSVADFRNATEGNTPLRRITQRYLLAYLGMVSQSVACNRLHSIEERFSRWVLMTHDRVEGDDFYLTQEFLADMLGVHRPSVSLVASAFQQAGIIKYNRGEMTIVNRAGLENICCECYSAVKSQYARLLGSKHN
ncbi:MAG: Crp/Fnr family transcriptional regulator [Herminiimonas sp.]|nr:Crp/Fnr family transcriptional regulator [Herminiimonas sp.]